MDRTLILVKPDAFARGLTGEIIARFENKGLRIVALKHMTVDEDLAKRHYAEHDLVAGCLAGHRLAQGVLPRDRDQPHHGQEMRAVVVHSVDALLRSVPAARSATR